MVLVAAEPPSNTLKTTERMVDDVADADQQIPRKGESSIVRHDDVGKFAEKMAVRILGDMITNLRLLPSFRAVFNELIKYLKDAKYVDIRGDAENDESNLVQRQFVLDVVGSEIRKMWGEDNDFQPELMREPYVSRTDRRDYAVSTLQQVKAHIDDFVNVMNTGRYDIKIISKFILFSREAKDQCFHVLNRLKNHEKYVDNADDVAGVVGRALTRLLKNDDVVLSLVGNGLDYNKPINIPLYKKYEMMTPKELEKVNIHDFFNGNNTYDFIPSESNPNTSTPSMTDIFSSKNYKRDPNDISHLIEEVNSEYFENMCQSLSGHFVPTSLRQFIWTYRLLQKNKSMPSSTNAPLLSKELYRRGASKGIKASDLDDDSNTSGSGRRTGIITASAMSSRRRSSQNRQESSGNPIKGLVSKMVAKYLGAISDVSGRNDNKAIGTKLTVMNEDEDEDTAAASKEHEDSMHERMGMDPREHAKLFKRVEHLVFAAYTLNGTLSERSIAISTLLLKLYPDDSPISEKILQLYHKACDVCLPSEHYNRKYSMANVTQKIWSLLGERDPDLYNHLQQYVDTNESVFDISVDKDRDANGNNDNRPEGLKSRGRMSRKSVVDFLNSEQSENLKKVQEEHTRSSILPSPPTTAKPDPSSQPPSGRMPPSPNENKDNSAALSFPKSFVFLRGWVENGFYAWLPDEAVYFLWDQMTMLSSEDSGGLSAQFERIIIGTCYVILHLCRKELLAVKENLIHRLHWAGKRLRTRVIVEAFRHYFLPDKTFSKAATLVAEKVHVDGEPQDGGGASTLHGSTFEHQGDGKLPLYVSGKNKKTTNEGEGGEADNTDQKETDVTDNNEKANSSIEKVESKSVAYVTDVEGNLEYWDQYLDQSEVIERGEPQEGELRGTLYLRDNTEVVYGGDVCDRGPGDIRFILEMLSLKERYPDRVHFILGNRDLNKLRFTFETTESQLSEPPKCYWLKNKDKSPHDFKADKVEPEGTPDKLSDRVKWMLKQTMGSPDCFEFRKEELGILGTHDEDEIVAQSFVDSVRADGFLTEFLSKGKIAHVIGDILWVHGAVTDFNMGYVPAYNGKEEQKIDDVHEWVREINAFVTHEMEDYMFNVENYLANSPPSDNWAAIGGDHHAQPASRLLTYGMGFHKDGSKVATAVYANFLDDKGAPKKVSEDVSNWLAKGGIRKLIVGHQPHGDCPMTIQCDNEVTVCGGDTSYAVGVEYVKNEALGDLDLGAPVKDKKQGAVQKLNTRGVACSDLLFYFYPEEENPSSLSTRSFMRVKGCLNTHQEYDFNFDKKIQEGKKQLVGTCTVDGWWIKGEIPAVSPENFTSNPPAPAEIAPEVAVVADGNSAENKTDNDDPLPAAVPPVSSPPSAAPSTIITTDEEALPAGYFLCKSEGFKVMNTLVAAGFIDSVIENGVKIIDEKKSGD